MRTLNMYLGFIEP